MTRSPSPLLRASLLATLWLGACDRAEPTAPHAPAWTGADSDERLRVLGPRVREGDVEALGEVLQIALDPAKTLGLLNPLEVALQHQALRTFLGLGEEHETIDREFYEYDLCLRAADDWYHENVLHTPSPWRSSPPEVFGEPFAKEKREAWAFALDDVALTQNWRRSLRMRAGPARTTPVDVRAFEFLDAKWVSSNYENAWVVFDMWSRKSDSVLAARLELEPSGNFRAWTATVSPRDYDALVASMLAVLDAQPLTWWGPRPSDTFFVGTIDPEDQPDRECTLAGLGLPARPVQPLKQFLAEDDAPTLAAVRWYERFLAARTTWVEAAVTPEMRDAFASGMRAHWTPWPAGFDAPHRRTLLLARHVGSPSVAPTLLRYLTPEYTNSSENYQAMARTAIEALVAITGTDLRSDAEGRPRPLPEVAEAYVQLVGPRPRTR